MIVQDQDTEISMAGHSHVFLGERPANERWTWAAILLTFVMMLTEILGGTLFGQLSHGNPHALALLIVALAYTYTRRQANDTRFVFGAGELGDLAGYTSAIVLAMIGFSRLSRFPMLSLVTDALARDRCSRS